MHVIKIVKKPKSPNSLINGEITNKGEKAKPVKTNINVLNSWKLSPDIFEYS